MGEFEEKLNSILSSPKDMEKILGLAREISGGEKSAARGGAEGGKEQGGPSAGDIDPRLLGLVSRIIGEYASGKNDKTALAAALRPYLREERREDLDKAVKYAGIARAAKAALKEFSGGGFNF